MLTSLKENLISECINLWQKVKNLEELEEFKSGLTIQHFIDYFLKRDGLITIAEMYNNEEIYYLINILISKKLYDDKIKTIPFDIENIITTNKNYTLKTISPFKYESAEN